MYIPRKFRFREDCDWLPDVEANPLATIVSIDAGSPVVAHIPIAITSDEIGRVAVGHVSRDNAIWQIWETTSVETTLVFTGQNAYISPMTYQDAVQVPTWNYVAVHLMGNPIPVHFDEAPQELHSILDLLIKQYEPAYLPVWQALDQHIQEKLLRGIVGFKMSINHVACAEKMSQNRTSRDAEAIAESLRVDGFSALASRMLEVR